MAWVSKYFTKNPNLKKRRKKIHFLFSVLCVCGGGEEGAGT